MGKISSNFDSKSRSHLKSLVIWLHEIKQLFISKKIPDTLEEIFIIPFSDKELIFQIHKEVLEKLKEKSAPKKSKHRSWTDGSREKKY